MAVAVVVAVMGSHFLTIWLTNGDKGRWPTPAATLSRVTPPLLLLLLLLVFMWVLVIAEVEEGGRRDERGCKW